MLTSEDKAWLIGHIEIYQESLKLVEKKKDVNSAFLELEREKCESLLNGLKEKTTLSYWDILWAAGNLAKYLKTSQDRKAPDPVTAHHDQLAVQNAAPLVKKLREILVARKASGVLFSE